MGTGRARLDLRWQSGILRRRHRDPGCLQAGAHPGERDRKRRAADQPAARDAAPDARDRRGARPRPHGRCRAGQAGRDPRQGPAEEDPEGVPRFRDGAIELRPARQRPALDTAAQYFASGARRRLGDLEWGVSGGGSMSQTMTSERGQKTDAKTYKNYIGGRGVESKSGKTFTSNNPAHKDQVLGVMQASNAEDVNAAIEAAQKAFDHWRRTPAPARGEIVLKAALIIEARKAELARLMTQEMGKVLKEAGGDVQEAIDMGKYAAGLGRHPHGETVPSELRNKWAMTVRVPLGVVACITPWNFPMAIPSWKIFPAGMAGNAVGVKPGAGTPIVATTLVEILEEAGLPRGGLNPRRGSRDDHGRLLPP